MIFRFLLLGVATAILAACGGGGDSAGGDGSPGGDVPQPAQRCVSVNTSRSYTTNNCQGCNLPNGPDAVDGSLFTYAAIDPYLPVYEGSIRARSGGPVFAGGTTGAFVTFKPGTGGSTRVTINTYLGSTPVETSTGQTLTTATTQGGTDAESFVSFQSTRAFDTVEIIMAGDGDALPSSADVRVYEICANGHV